MGLTKEILSQLSSPNLSDGDRVQLRCRLASSCTNRETMLGRATQWENSGKALDTDPN